MVISGVNYICNKQEIDVIIGTFCIHNHFSLFNDERDFEPSEIFLKQKLPKSYNSIQRMQ
ncbi:MAG: hypothetical protein A2161_09560 [Candidatus Schekmanbacteria bacterium RBG_13_48_7]|uniref:Uncharacterized protein n=1 Tax=Candidatus Schekmanbacteria bacterium RBG_13_48_7 TaxID=1817878 RepID=A0A1F7RX15_9BACT|nr:MAG: hypothetical protein A2161_09560 [Candidatus Schekmanbacteria bacterium RBG_13_48_7]